MKSKESRDQQKYITHTTSEIEHVNTVLEHETNLTTATCYGKQMEDKFLIILVIEGPLVSNKESCISGGYWTAPNWQSSVSGDENREPLSCISGIYWTTPTWQPSGTDD